MEVSSPSSISLSSLRFGGSNGDRWHEEKAGWRRRRRWARAVRVVDEDSALNSVDSGSCGGGGLTR
jgi:hypothetical protein